MANACILGIIIGKFGYWQDFNSVVLLEIDKNLKVGFYFIILLLNLTVYLRMKGDIELVLNPEEII